MIPFNKPYMTGKELWYVSQALASGHLAGDGIFTKKCNAWLERRIGCAKALLTHSCTAALEMAAILADIRPGDEIIMPSYFCLDRQCVCVEGRGTGIRRHQA